MAIRVLHRQAASKKAGAATVLDLTSRGPEPWVRFSPFWPHGDIPVPRSPGRTPASVEGIWQALKVFVGADVDERYLGITTMRGLKRGARKFGAVRGHRDGLAGTDLLGYIAARRALYLPAYRWVLDHRLQPELAELRRLAGDRKPEDCAHYTLYDLLGQTVELHDSLRSSGVWKVPGSAGADSMGATATNDTDSPAFALIEWEQLRVSGIPGVAALLTLCDVTRECELETDRDRLATVADESPYPIVEIDRDGNILYVNPAMVEVLCRFGYDLSGRPDILPDNLPTLVATCLLEGRTLRSQDVVRGEVCYSWTLCPVPSNHLVRAYGTDLTEVYATHRALNASATRQRSPRVE